MRLSRSASLPKRTSSSHANSRHPIGLRNTVNALGISIRNGVPALFLIFFALPYGRITQNRTTVIANSPVGSTAWTTLLVVNADSCQAGYWLIETRNNDNSVCYRRLPPHKRIESNHRAGGKYKI